MIGGNPESEACAWASLARRNQVGRVKKNRRQRAGGLFSKDADARHPRSIVQAAACDAKLPHVRASMRQRINLILGILIVALAIGVVLAWSHQTQRDLDQERARLLELEHQDAVADSPPPWPHVDALTPLERAEMASLRARAKARGELVDDDRGRN